jgi:predicted ATPase
MGGLSPKVIRKVPRASSQVSTHLQESGQTENRRKQHARYFLALAEAVEPRLWGPEDVEWFERLEAEHDNMRAALSWALQRGESELGLRLAGTLWTFWQAHAYQGEGRKRWPRTIGCRWQPG